MWRITILSCATLALVISAAEAWAWDQHRISHDRGETIDQRALMCSVGAMYRIDPDLLGAIAIAESGGRPDAVSPRGAVGLMQLMPTTAREFDVDDSYDPIDNALGAARFISSLRVRQGSALVDSGDLVDLIAAYNAGEGAVERYGGVPPYDETRDYVRRVLWLYLAGIMPPDSISRSAGFATQPRKSGFARRDPYTDARASLSELRRERSAATVQPDSSPAPAQH